ncbi:MAG: family 10 glycosylhydrolase [Lachnospiraceae bacterium]|nr:family 10 glycosylhydrolase [Lachnospiraceae bacterium]
MKKSQIKRILSFCVVTILTAMFFLGDNRVQADAALQAKKVPQAKSGSLHISADYDAETFTQSLEVTLSVESSSELTTLMYAYARVAKTTYFTKYTDYCFEIEQNADGAYTFSIEQNGYVSVFAVNEAGEEVLLVFNVDNVDKESPVVTVTSQKTKDSYMVTMRAEDNLCDNISLQYVEGAYASPSDSVWAKAEVFTNEKELLLSEGKYTFMATDEAGNTHIIIRRFGENKETQEFRAVWITYLEFKTTGYTKKEFQAEIETMFNEISAMNMNAVVVHVRPFSDAMYSSSYFPWSRYISGTQGKNPGFDPLEIMVEEAHARGLEIHAWLNPYRITSSSTDVNDLSKDNPARIYRTDSNKNNDRNVLTYDGKLYYNPASKEVQTLIINGIREIVENYDVDGIHFDDYFYPTLGKNFTSNFDAPEYETYKKEQIAKGKSYLSIADWRRENVNSLVRGVYAAVKEINPDAVFGISPGGFMDALKADDKYYVDFETWLGHDGYIDYLCPQLYWSNDHTVYPYNNILKRFIDAAVNPDVKLYVGIAAYKAGIKTEGNAWYQDANVLRNMIQYARNTKQVDGFILYSYRYLISKRNYTSIKNMLKEFQ